MNIENSFVSRMRVGRCSAEDGVAMFYALLVVLVVGGVVAVVMATSMGELRQSAAELDFEDSLHLAEAGLEITLQRLNEDSAYATVGEDGALVLGPTSVEEPFDWAVEAATEPNASSPSGYNLPAVDFGEGEAVAIRPSGTHANYAYGIGFHPSRDAYADGHPEAYTRVVRVQMGFSDTEVAGEFAVLAGVRISNTGGAYGVGGLNGSIHTNGELALTHDNVDGTISYTGDCTGSVCAGDPDVEGPVEEVTLPEKTIDDIWGTPDAEEIASDGDWFDYCDGTGRHTGVSGAGWYQRGAGDDAPCSGTKLVSPSQPDGWSALNFSSIKNPDAVYWIDSTSSVSVSHIDGPATVIAMGDIDFGPSGNDGGMSAKYPGLLLFSEGNVTVSGNNVASDPDGAIVYAGGDVDLLGTTDSVNIAYIAVGEVIVHGTAQVSYNGDAVADLGGDSEPLVLEWDEIRGS